MDLNKGLVLDQKQSKSAFMQVACGPQEGPAGRRALPTGRRRVQRAAGLRVLDYVGLTGRRLSLRTAGGPCGPQEASRFRLSRFLTFCYK